MLEGQCVGEPEMIPVSLCTHPVATFNYSLPLNAVLGLLLDQTDALQDVGDVIYAPFLSDG